MPAWSTLEWLSVIGFVVVFFFVARFIYQKIMAQRAKKGTLK